MVDDPSLDELTSVTEESSVEKFDSVEKAVLLREVDSIGEEGFSEYDEVSKE
jgi:hypothetical protein